MRVKAVMQDAGLGVKRHIHMPTGIATLLVMSTVLLLPAQSDKDRRDWNGGKNFVFHMTKSLTYLIPSDDHPQPLWITCTSLLLFFFVYSFTAFEILLPFPITIYTATKLTSHSFSRFLFLKVLSSSSSFC